jgi:hypothetical protein
MISDKNFHQDKGIVGFFSFAIVQLVQQVFKQLVMVII